MIGRGPDSLNLFRGSRTEALDLLAYRRERSIGSRVSGLNAAVYNLACHDPELREALRTSTVLLPDGISAVWAWRFSGIAVKERIATPDLVEDLLQSWSSADVYLLGGSSVVVEAARRELVRRKIRIVGCRDGFWEPRQEPLVISDVVEAAPNLILLALPSPKKEQLALGLAAVLPEACVVGVGGYFDILAGHTSRAPRWVGRAGLEWLFRLVQEPRRLGRRYFVGNFMFVWNVLRARGRERFDR